jgi:hypothetical protein
MLAMVTSLGLVSGCGSEMNRVAAIFSQAHFCPSDQMEVTERPDLVPSPALPPPPEALAGDPERAALWARLKQNEAITSRLTTSDPVPVEITGCGLHGIYVCELGRRGGCKYASLRALEEEAIPSP